MNNPSKNLKLAEQGALLAIVTYILLSTTKLIAGSMLHSSSLTADGFNNISDIVANIAVLIGLRMARKPADMDHKFGHWKIEDLASLITSLIMFFVGLDVLFETVQKIISKQVTAIDPLGAIVGFISAIIMTGVYLFNKKLAKKHKIWYYNYKNEILGRKSGRFPLFSFKYEVDILWKKYWKCLKKKWRSI